MSSPPVLFETPAGWGEGPIFSEKLQLSKAHPEPVYLTSLSVRVVDGQGQGVEDPGPVLDWWEVAWANPERHGELIGRSSVDTATLIRMGGGERLFRLPDGCGLPMFSNEGLSFRGGWSGQAVATGEECKVELELTYQRARELGQPLTPVRVLTAWAGTPGDLNDPRSWLVNAGEAIRGSCKYPSGTEVLAQHWLRGPGVGQVTVDETVADKIATLTFSSVSEPAPRPTALGVNLVLSDQEWPGWK